jgi:starch phosphorylase
MRMRESMARLAPRFSANRTVREYTEQHYLPAAAAYSQRAADKGAMGVQLVNWQRALEQRWSDLRFGEMKIATEGGNHLFEVQVYLSGLDPNTVRVELYADGMNDGEPIRHEMKCVWQPAAGNGTLYRTQVPTTRPAKEFTVRVVPYCSGVAVPLEAAQILWQH